MRMGSRKMWHILWRIFENSWSSRRMENLLRRENSQVSKRRKRTSRGKMGRSLNPLKESRASNATDMDISRKSVPIIWEGRARRITNNITKSMLLTTINLWCLFSNNEDFTVINQIQLDHGNLLQKFLTPSTPLALELT